MANVVSGTGRAKGASAHTEPAKLVRFAHVAACAAVLVVEADVGALAGAARGGVDVAAFAAAALTRRKRQCRADPATGAAVLVIKLHALDGNHPNVIAARFRGLLIARLPALGQARRARLAARPSGAKRLGLGTASYARAAIEGIGVQVAAAAETASWLLALGTGIVATSTMVLVLLEVPAVELIDLGVALPNGLRTAHGHWRAPGSPVQLSAVA